jgi:hypothetical protein
MQHIILVLAMILLITLAGKQLTVKEAVNNRLMQIEKVQAAKTYELPDEEEDIYKTEFSIGSCYTDLFQ